jgi:hypothetical protein
LERILSKTVWSTLSRLSRQSFKPSRTLCTGRQQLLVLPFRTTSSFKSPRTLPVHPGRKLLLALPFRSMSNPLSRSEIPARKLSSLSYLHRERKCHGIPSCCFVCLPLLCCWCWCDRCAFVAVMLLVCCCWSCVELFCLLCTVEVWCCFHFLVSHRSIISELQAWWRAVLRLWTSCCRETDFTPLFRYRSPREWQRVLPASLGVVSLRAIPWHCCR